MDNRQNTTKTKIRKQEFEEIKRFSTAWTANTETAQNKRHMGVLHMQTNQREKQNHLYMCTGLHM